ncbi:MAG: phosphoglycerate kinase [Candidatus Levybacteria bacterium]|nr:phosphoglycerate kinase [Candidatus Levybacteria bacterium]
MQLPDIRNADVRGKTILLRSDIDVPLSDNGAILDDTRLQASLPTIRFLLEHGAKVIICGKLGRPEGVDKKLSLDPVAKWYEQQFKNQNAKIKTKKIDGFEGWEITEHISLLENLQFDPKERATDPELAKKLASLADVYVNDAFAVCHRSLASTVGVAKLLPYFAGFRLLEETNVLSSVLRNPNRPFVVVIGGAKIETKLPLVEKMHQLADYVLVGGKIAGQTSELVRVQHKKLVGKKSVLLVAELNSKETDITEKSVDNFLQIINLAKTIVWNGPLGKVEEVTHATEAIARGVVSSGAYTVVGGGDTSAFLKKIGLLHKFSFASTGGGAMLAFLSGEDLPGLSALMR